MNMQFNKNRSQMQKFENNDQIMCINKRRT